MPLTCCTRVALRYAVFGCAESPLGIQARCPAGGLLPQARLIALCDLAVNKDIVWCTGHISSDLVFCEAFYMVETATGSMSDGCIQWLLGPLCFTNHSCKPNAKVMTTLQFYISH